MTRQPRQAARGRHTASDRRTSGVPLVDANMDAADLLYDMAALQSGERAELGYRRAAAAVIALPAPIADVHRAGELLDVPFIGPSSAAILAEYVEAGTSATVERAVAASGRREAVLDRRRLRRGFLSHVGMEAAHALELDQAIVSRRHFRGDFQMHSTWSDGAERVAALAAACAALGHACMGLTDHSHGLRVARGMTMAQAVRQHQEIDRANARHAGRFRIFKGIEANILADGSLDLTRDERAVFEYVVAAPHSLLRRDDDQTPRMLAAVIEPGVAVLGHPRGRMFDRRAGISADWRRVFAAAARHGVAVEIDGNWHRQDVDYALAGEALQAGCLLALDSDAHSIAELRFADYAIAHARLARVPADRVVNCWTDERLLEWMGGKRAALRRGAAPPRPGSSGTGAGDRSGSR